MKALPALLALTLAGAAAADEHGGVTLFPTRINLAAMCSSSPPDLLRELADRYSEYPTFMGDLGGGKYLYITENGESGGFSALVIHEDGASCFLWGGKDFHMIGEPPPPARASGFRM